MSKGRLEAFSDGVLAIIITIMVLELKVPHGADFSSLQQLLPVFISYILSFIYIGIYWNNHHHLLQATKQINGKILWANMHLLFWLSLIPFASGWMGENHFASLPVLLYGLVLLMAAFAYYILSHQLIKLHGKNSTLATAFGKDIKGILSMVFYIIGISMCFFNSWIGFGIYVVVAAIWFLPDTRLEKKIYTGD